MDCRTGQLVEFEDSASLRKAIESEDGKHLIPLTDRQAEQMKPMEPAKRKNWMRNRKCICGSGKKFKICCWSKFA